jgi:cell division protein ZipA
MNITSILITIVGIILIIALYLLSRISQSKLPKIQTNILPDIKDEKGDKFTSVLDDIAARDGSTPASVSADEKTFKNSAQMKVVKTTKKTENTGNNKNSAPKQEQIVLFITAEDMNGLDGNSIEKTLINNGLSFGDKDIYHYLIQASANDNQTKKSLFRIANGVQPWTLTQQDLTNKKIAGLSVVMFLPAIIHNNEAINILLKAVEKIAYDLKGVVKNQQQQLLTEKDKEILINQFN